MNCHQHRERTATDLRLNGWRSEQMQLIITNPLDGLERKSRGRTLCRSRAVMPPQLSRQDRAHLFDFRDDEFEKRADARDVPQVGVGQQVYWRLQPW